ncbi:hypothetical protein U27_04308 [Candidatus Vecturithrix granuli]|uniref:Uncharacterized protein n=1 Tax=Vecturithrix granuli TaxID=1499967 RepID=A0A081BYD8_VECG1|nr:hypothetical protein U27_04308 [Candidatus Vecturithrix granuli]
MPGVQAGHKREQQRSFGQAVEPFAGQDRAFEQFRPSLHIFRIQAAQLTHVRVPALYKAPDLPLTERREHGFRKTLQTPILLLVRVGAAGHDDTAARRAFCELLDRLLNLCAAMIRFRHFIQAIQQQ